MAGVLRKTDSTSWAWCGQVGKKHQRAHRNSKKHSRLSRLFFCYLLLAMYSNLFRPTASLKAVHTIYTQADTRTPMLFQTLLFLYMLIQLSIFWLKVTYFQTPTVGQIITRFFWKCWTHLWEIQFYYILYFRLCNATEVFSVSLYTNVTTCKTIHTQGPLPMGCPFLI